MIVTLVFLIAFISLSWSRIEPLLSRREVMSDEDMIRRFTMSRVVTEVNKRDFKRRGF